MGIIKYQSAWRNDTAFNYNSQEFRPPIQYITTKITKVYIIDMAKAAKGEIYGNISKEFPNNTIISVAGKSNLPTGPILMINENSWISANDAKPLASNAPNSVPLPNKTSGWSTNPVADKKYELLTDIPSVNGMIKTENNTTPMNGLTSFKKGDIVIGAKPISREVGMSEIQMWRESAPSIYYLVNANILKPFNSSLSSTTSDTLTGVGNIISNGNWQSKAIYGGLFCLVVFGLLKWQKII